MILSTIPQIKNHNVQQLSDLVDFWLQRPKLADSVLPYLWWPVSSAAIERSFSLAGIPLFLLRFLKSFVTLALVDMKNRNRASEGLQAAAIGMFCNGDVEQRFHKGIPFKGRLLPVCFGCILAASSTSNED